MKTEPDFHNSVRLVPHTALILVSCVAILFCIYFIWTDAGRYSPWHLDYDKLTGFTLLYIPLLNPKVIQYNKKGLRLTGMFGVRIVPASQISDYYADEHSGLVTLSSGRKIGINYKIYSSASIAEFEAFIYGLIGRTLDSYPDEDDVEFFNEHLHRPLQPEELPSGKKLGR